MTGREHKALWNKASGDLMHHPLLQWAGGILLVVAGYLLTWRLRWAMDISFLDETGYLVRGLNMFPKIPKLWGPVYCFWYKILSFFQSDPVALYYLNFGLISVLLALVMYVFLIRFRVAWPVAFWICLFLLIAPFNLPTFPKVSHFGAIAGVGGLIAAYYIRNNLHRYLFIALVFMVLSYVRPESYISFLLVALGIVAGLATKRLKFGAPAIPVVIVVVIAILHLGLGMPLGVELRGYKRSFIAFGEHFAYNYSKWNDINAYLWLTWESVVQAVFGDVSGFADAFRENPSMMWKHLWSNVKLYILEFGQAFGSLLIPLDRLPLAGQIGLPVAVLGSLAFPRIRKAYLARLMHHRALLVFLVLLALPSALSCVVIYPRDHYIIMQLPLLVWLLAELLSTIVVGIPSIPWKRGLSLAALLLSGLYFINARHAYDYTYFELRKENGKLNNLTVLKMLNDNRKVMEGVKILSHEGDFSAFVTPDIEFVNAIEKGQTPFPEFLKEVDPDIIYCTETIFKNPNYMDDDAWIDFFGTLNQDTLEWEYFKVNGGQWDFLLLKAELYQQLRDDSPLPAPRQRDRGKRPER